ncbi:MAG: hypothetical protein M3040_01605 [Bacteroidota bacterium]|nr:hypothetical protein [Bacteroidota bacterium]
MATCTVFKNFAYPVENKSIIILAKEIASDKFKAPVEEIRSLIAQGKPEEAAAKKEMLLAFTPSATFKEKRLPTHVNQYSGFIHLDFDKLSPEQMEVAFAVISSTPYTFLCFKSPSGNGLKVFVEVTTGAEYHFIAYHQVTQFYEQKLGIPSDPKCKDITRLCFISHHPQLYKNINHVKFDVNINAIPKTDPTKETASTEQEENEYTQALQECVIFTEQKKAYIDGNRNEFIYVLASNCNRRGIPLAIAEAFAINKYDLPKRKLKMPSTVRTPTTAQNLQSLQSLQTRKLQNPKKKRMQKIT